MTQPLRGPFSLTLAPAALGPVRLAAAEVRKRTRHSQGHGHARAPACAGRGAGGESEGEREKSCGPAASLPTTDGGTDKKGREEKEESDE